MDLTTQLARALRELAIADGIIHADGSAYPLDGLRRGASADNVRAALHAYASPAPTVRAHPDHLTAAYVGIGAFEALREATAETHSERARRADAVLDSLGGQLGYIGDITKGALRLDQLADAYPDGLTGVFAYEVAENYGALVGAAVLAGETLDRHALAVRLVQEAAQ